MAKSNLSDEQNVASSTKKTFKPLTWKKIIDSFIAGLIVVLMLIFNASFYQKNGMTIDPENLASPAIAVAGITMFVLFLSLLYAIIRFAILCWQMLRNTFKFKEYNLFGKFIMPILSIAMLLFVVLVFIATIGLTITLSNGLLNNPEGKDWDLAGRLIHSWMQMINSESPIGAFFILYGLGNIGFVAVGLVYVLLAHFSKKKSKINDQNQSQPIVNQNQQ